jgi:hypothetical protein
LALQAFQYALSELVASPQLCVAVRAGKIDFFKRFDLSETEKARLMEVVWQPGMSVSCSMYRSNRITPIYTLLNFTCFLLGADLKKEVDEFWRSSQLPDLQFKEEIERFGRHLKGRITAGAITNPFVGEVLNFELAMNELQFLPRQKILCQIQRALARGEAGPFRVNPLIRVLLFRHEPFEVVDILRQGRAPSDELPRGEFFVVLSAVEEQIDMKRLDANLGSVLFRIQNQRVCQQYTDELRGLIQLGLSVPVELDDNSGQPSP